MFFRNVIAVARREFRLWRRRPVYLIGSIVPLVFCSIFFITFFGTGMPEKLPIAVVDNDNSSLTRNFIRQLDATQLGAVKRYSNYSEAREDLQRGEVTAICVLPAHLMEDVTAGRRPTFTFYVNGLYFVAGALSYKNILQMINLTGGAVQRETLRARGVNEKSIMGIIRPIDIDTHQIGNPTTDYGIYLINGLLPGILEMTVILILVYSLGAEMKYGTSRHLLETAGGNMRVAVYGKLGVYTILFCMLGWGMVGLLYLWMGFPLAGSFAAMLLDVTLLVVASEAIAVTIVSLIPVCRFALSIGALYSVLGFSMAGFSLPVESLLPEIQGFAEMFPLRHYYQFFVQESLFASGFPGWYPEVIHLLVFMLVPVILLRRLERAYIFQDYPKN